MGRRNAPLNTPLLSPIVSGPVGAPDLRMAPVSLPNMVLGRKMKKFGALFVTMGILWGLLSHVTSYPQCQRYFPRYHHQPPTPTDTRLPLLRVTFPAAAEAAGGNLLQKSQQWAEPRSPE